MCMDGNGQPTSFANMGVSILSCKISKRADVGNKFLVYTFENSFFKNLENASGSNDTSFFKCF